MNIVNARKKRGKTLILFRPVLALQIELVPQTTIAHCLVAVADLEGDVPGSVGTAGGAKDGTHESQ
jgi:hypothetical protein